MGHGRRAEDRAPLVALGVGEEATALLVVVGRQRDTAHGDEVRGVEALESLGAFLTLYGQGLLALDGAIGAEAVGLCEVGVTRADAVRQRTRTDEYGYVARTDLGTAIRVALGIVDVVGVGDPTILLLLVVVVGDVAEELVAVATIGGEDAVASILATPLRVEATGIGVVEARSDIQLFAEVRPEVRRDDVLTLVALEVLVIAHVGEGRLRVVEAYRIGRVEHAVVAVGIEEVADTARAIEEELRLPQAIRIPQIGDPERAELR